MPGLRCWSAPAVESPKLLYDRLGTLAEPMIVDAVDEARQDTATWTAAKGPPASFRAEDLVLSPRCLSNGLAYPRGAGVRCSCAKPCRTDHELWNPAGIDHRNRGLG